MLVPYCARSSTQRQISHLIWLPTHSPSGSTISRKQLTIRPSNNCSPTSIQRTRCFLAPTSRWSSNSDHLEFTEIRRSEPGDFGHVYGINYRVALGKYSTHSFEGYSIRFS